MEQPLYALPCFSDIETIVPIIAGLSSHCFQINADSKTFFAKKITAENEVNISLHAASNNLSPQVIYHDQHWLINEFIIGKNLALEPQPIAKKTIIAIKLMAQCHQMTVKPIKLKPIMITSELIENTSCSNKQKTKLLQTAKQLSAQLEHTKHLVCCHGDLNFSNILIDPEENAYLVDFECARAAPAEYDLAMFIAVNNINKNQTSTIIEHYIKYAQIDIDLTLFNHFLDFCYFINGLWYTHACHQTKLDKFSLLAKQQWNNIQC